MAQATKKLESTIILHTELVIRITKKVNYLPALFPDIKRHIIYVSPIKIAYYTIYTYLSRHQHNKAAANYLNSAIQLILCESAIMLTAKSFPNQGK